MKTMTKTIARRCAPATALGAIGVVIVAAALSACTSRPEAARVESAAPVQVTLAKATMSDAADTFDAGGVVQARTTAALTARILAPVREVRVAPGDRVRAGQVLVVLDGRDLTAHARSAQAAARAAGQGAEATAAEQRAADAALVLARASYDRIAGLEAKRSATRQELDEATAGLRAAEARVASAGARAQQAASSLESATAASEAAGTTESFALVTAPFDGVVTEKMVEPGNTAAPGTPLLRIEDTRGYRLEVRVDESRLGQVRPGAAVTVALDVSAGTGAATVVGTVSEVGRAVDADARAFLVKIALPETAGLRSGMFGRAQFPGEARRALMIPAGAIVHRGQVVSVFVVEKGVARVRLVNVRGREVLAGVSEGEKVVVNPQAELTDGRQVREGGQ